MSDAPKLCIHCRWFTSDRPGDDDGLCRKEVVNPVNGDYPGPYQKAQVLRYYAFCGYEARWFEPREKHGRHPA